MRIWIVASDLSDIGSFTEACERCWKGSGLPAKVVADHLGIEYKHFVRMFNRNDPRHFPPDKIEDLMIVCKSVLPLEWLAWRQGYALHSLELTDVLRAIRDVLSEDGRRPLFKICENDRLEKV